MANHKSAIKRNRQNIKKREHNRTVKSAVRTAIKKTLNAVETKDVKSAKEFLREATRVVARAANRGKYHPKNGSRKVSRLAKAVARLESASA